MINKRDQVPGLAVLGVLLLAACSGQLQESQPDSAAPPVRDGAGPPPPSDGAVDRPPADSAADGASPDAAVPPPKKPRSLTPCKAGKCWSASTLGSLCGVTSFAEDFSSGKYNVHRFSLSPKPKVKVELTLQPTAGSWKPALIIHDAKGVTVYDGELGLSTTELDVQPLASGKGSGSARVRLLAQQQMALQLYLTGWSVVQSKFVSFLPKSARYTLGVSTGCAPPKPGKLLSPPNFDAKNVVNGFYLLPPSQPPGLYKRKADGCSRGTRLLIDVLYTVAYHWKQQWPSLAPISYLDLNQGSCSSVNHQTHKDGTHADLTAGCATQVSCKNNQPGIDLAKLFIDTGQACGIINNDTAIQAVVNAYFKTKFSYKPWHGTFMRSVSGHTHHFHVRVKKPDGTCN